MLRPARHVNDLAILEADAARDLEQIVSAIGHCGFRLFEQFNPRVADRVLEGMPRAVVAGGWSLKCECMIAPPGRSTR